MRRNNLLIYSWEILIQKTEIYLRQIDERWWVHPDGIETSGYAYYINKEFLDDHRN